MIIYENGSGTHCLAVKVLSIVINRARVGLVGSMSKSPNITHDHWWNRPCWVGIRLQYLTQHDTWVCVGELELDLKWVCDWFELWRGLRWVRARNFYYFSFFFHNITMTCDNYYILNKITSISFNAHKIYFHVGRFQIILQYDIDT